MIADMEANKKLSLRATELFILYQNLISECLKIQD